MLRAMAPEIDAAHLAELRIGRLFVHGYLSATTTDDPVYGRVATWNDQQVAFDVLRREHGEPERAERFSVRHQQFFAEVLGEWYAGHQLPPLGPRIHGYRLPLRPRRSDRGQRW
jgi:hypothetical protein